MSRVISFRGLLADGAQEEISLQTNNGLTGYRIIKFEIMPEAPGVSSGANVTKIYKVSQSAIDALVDFSENTMLGAAYYASEPSSYSDNKSIIFDNEKFNQNIFVTNKDARGNSTGVNYYIELEQMKLDLNEATVATLKDVRNNS